MFQKWFLCQKFKPCKPEEVEGISEPILSFVELFKSNPKRFKVYSDPLSPNSFVYIVKDKENSFTCKVYAWRCWMGFSDNLDWITDKEWLYIYKELSIVFKNRKDRLLSLQRKKYMNLYGPKENS
jgi:hypothetical protein